LIYGPWAGGAQKKLVHNMFASGASIRKGGLRDGAIALCPFPLQ